MHIKDISVNGYHFQEPKELPGDSASTTPLHPPAQDANWAQVTDDDDDRNNSCQRPFRQQ